jgi:hypothetical protein
MSDDEDSPRTKRMMQEAIAESLRTGPRPPAPPSGPPGGGSMASQVGVLEESVRSSRQILEDARNMLARNPTNQRLQTIVRNAEESHNHATRMLDRQRTRVQSVPVQSVPVQSVPVVQQSVAAAPSINNPLDTLFAMLDNDDSGHLDGVELVDYLNGLPFESFNIVNPGLNNIQQAIASFLGGRIGITQAEFPEFIVFLNEGLKNAGLSEGMLMSYIESVTGAAVAPATPQRPAVGPSAPVVRPPAPVVRPPAPVVRPPAPVVRPPAPVVRQPTKEEIQDRQVAEVKGNLENRAVLLRQEANRAFNSPIPGLTGEFRNTTYKQFTQMTQTTNPDSDIHHSFQNDLQGTIAVLENYYEANSRRVGTTQYNRSQIFNDLFTWLQASEEFNLPAPRGEWKGFQKRNIDLATRRRMVEYVMSCIDEFPNENGTTYDTSNMARSRSRRPIHVDSENLLNLIYTFIKGQPQVLDFRSIFAAAFVRGIIESYEKTSDPNGVTIHTFGQNPNARPACRSGGTHYMLPMFDQALNAVFGESPPELTEEQKEVMRKPEQTRKINEWLQQGYNQDNSTADSVQEYIYRRIREEGGNPEQWRATSGNDELTVKQLITRMGLFGGKRRNQRKTRNQRNQRKNNKTKHVKQRI